MAHYHCMQQVFFPSTKLVLRTRRGFPRIGLIGHPQSFLVFQKSFHYTRMKNGESFKFIIKKKNHLKKIEME